MFSIVAMKVYYKTKTENQKKKTDGTYNDYSNAKKVNERKRRVSIVLLHIVVIYPCIITYSRDKSFYCYR